MKVCIFGNLESTYENKLKYYLESLDIDVKILSIRDIYIHINKDIININHRKYDLLDFDIFLYSKLPKGTESLVYIVSDYLHKKGKKIIDSTLCKEEYHPEKLIFKLSEHNLKFIETYNVYSIKTGRDILIDLDHPILIRNQTKKGKIKLFKSDDWTDSYDHIRTEKINTLNIYKYYKNQKFIKTYIINGLPIYGIEYDTKESKNDLFFYSIIKNKNIITSFSQNEIEFFQKVKEVSNLEIFSIYYIKQEDDFMILKIERSPIKNIKTKMQHLYVKEISNFIVNNY